MTMEIERRRLATAEPENIVRGLELAAFFAHCDLQPVHLQLALRSAVSSPLPLLLRIFLP